MMQEQEAEFVPDEESGGGEAALKRLRERLKKAVEEKQEYLTGWQRARADFANFKKEELAREGEREVRLKSEFAEALIPTLDALEMALKSHPTKELQLLQRQLLASLKKLHIERFGEVGELFDPHRHEALIHRGDGEAIESVERSGYSIGKKIIRPAQVII